MLAHPWDTMIFTTQQMSIEVVDILDRQVVFLMKNEVFPKGKTPSLLLLKVGRPAPGF
ncbi:MAG: hypothetical protein R2788_13670 [Saprospiraceae bacterium]